MIVCIPFAAGDDGAELGEAGEAIRYYINTEQISFIQRETAQRGVRGLEREHSRTIIHMRCGSTIEISTEDLVTGWTHDYILLALAIGIDFVSPAPPPVATTKAE